MKQSSELVTDRKVREHAKSYREKARSIVLQPREWVTGDPQERAKEYDEIADLLLKLTH